MGILKKRHNHVHFWISTGILYESYNTTRGLRYSRVKEVGTLRDTDKCTPELIEYIEEHYITEEEEKKEE